MWVTPSACGCLQLSSNYSSFSDFSRVLSHARHAEISFQSCSLLTLSSTSTFEFNRNRLSQRRSLAYSSIVLDEWMKKVNSLREPWWVAWRASSELGFLRNFTVHRPRRPEETSREEKTLTNLSPTATHRVVWTAEGRGEDSRGWTLPVTSIFTLSFCNFLCWIDIPWLIIVKSAQILGKCAFWSRNWRLKQHGVMISKNIVQLMMQLQPWWRSAEYFLEGCTSSPM